MLNDVGAMMYMSVAYGVLFLLEYLSHRLQTLALRSLCIEVYYYDFFLRIPSCSSRFIQDYTPTCAAQVCNYFHKGYVRKYASAQVLAQVRKCTATCASACMRKYLPKCVSAQLLSQVRKCASE